MSEKVTMAEGAKDVLVLVISGLGLSIEPHVFIACLFLASGGAVIGRGFSPTMAHRRAFGLTLGAGLLFTILALLLDHVCAGVWAWWPALPPQLISIFSGIFGPLTIAFLMKKYPVIAERVLGRVLPDPNAATSGLQGE